MGERWEVEGGNYPRSGGKQEVKCGLSSSFFYCNSLFIYMDEVIKLLHISVVIFTIINITANYCCS